jgi:hypothetical protein
MGTAPLSSVVLCTQYRSRLMTRSSRCSRHSLDRVSAFHSGRHACLSGTALQSAIACAQTQQRSKGLSQTDAHMCTGCDVATTQHSTAVKLSDTDSGPAPRTFLLHAILSLHTIDLRRKLALTAAGPGATAPASAVRRSRRRQIYMYVDRPRVYPVSSIYAARYDLNAWIARVLESS